MRSSARFPTHGYAGALIVLAAEVGLFAGVGAVRAFFTPIVWTGYILLADGAVFALTGRSQLSTDRAEFARTALLSIPIWLVFEAYNLRLKNWEYVGLPDAAPLRILGYGWSFATILPGLFETSDLLLALGFGRDARTAPAVAPAAASGVATSAPPSASPAAGGRFVDGADDGLGSPGTRVALVTFGGLCLILPLVALPLVAPSLFGLVWIGFLFVLDPINASLGRWAPFAEWARGRRRRFVSLLAGGLACGVLWEFWNYWAGARWVYTFPILQEWKLFEMPLPGFLGFPPFAVECFLMYELISTAWRGGWGRDRRRASTLAD